MASNELLGVYLNDHLGGSAAGVEIAETLQADNQGTAFGEVMAALLRDIEEDRATLEDLMERLGVERNPVKQALGWVAEKVSRLKLNALVSRSADLTRLLQTETLSLGIEGKQVMWQVLREARDTRPELATTDFDRLIDRARRQRETLEPYRKGAALKAFSP
jgi:hypothetical protein